MPKKRKKLDRPELPPLAEKIVASLRARATPLSIGDLARRVYGRDTPCDRANLKVQLSFLRYRGYVITNRRPPRPRGVGYLGYVLEREPG